jgi:hypothetical protein
MTYHFEIVNFLPDLLGKQRSEAVASRDFTSAVILATGPGVMKLDTRAESDISPRDRLGSDGGALGVGRVVSPSFGQEVVLARNLDVISLTGSSGLIGGSRGARVR